VTGRVILLALMAGLLAQVAAAHGSADAKGTAATYYLGRADPRACPSPMCGGIWLKAVNGVAGSCARPPRFECYVAGFTLGVPDEEKQARLEALVTNGGGLVQGRIVPAGIQGFPELRALRVVGAWRPAGKHQPTGVFRQLRDNGIRCITTPCFSVTATTLNTGRRVTVSGVDLRPSGASAADVRRGQTLIATRSLLAAGRIVSASRGGRTFVASRLYLPTR
jgi:hypothetical protein